MIRYRLLRLTTGAAVARPRASLWSVPRAVKAPPARETDTASDCPANGVLLGPDPSRAVRVTRCPQPGVAVLACRPSRVVATAGRSWLLQAPAPWLFSARTRNW